MATAWLHELKRAGRAFTEGLLHLFLPACCHACGQPPGAPLEFFCGPCKSRILADDRIACARCAATVGPYAAREQDCRHCRNESFAFERTICLGRYDGLLRDLALRLKHAQNEGLAEVLGELWAVHAADEFRALAVEAVVPVPLHWRRRWQRGYNQSAALARGLAAQLGCSLVMRGLRRVRHTPSQAGLTGPGRRENLRGAFAPGWACRSLAGKCVLLVDDVMTTGATVHEATRALRAASVKRVIVAALARAS